MGKVKGSRLAHMTGDLSIQNVASSARMGTYSIYYSTEAEIFKN
jgi:rRNA maturation endonuclease Nob1